MRIDHLAVGLTCLPRIAPGGHRKEKAQPFMSPRMFVRTIETEKVMMLFFSEQFPFSIQMYYFSKYYASSISFDPPTSRLGKHN